MLFGMLYCETLGENFCHSGKCALTPTIYQNVFADQVHIFMEMVFIFWQDNTPFQTAKWVQNSMRNECEGFTWLPNYSYFNPIEMESAGKTNKIDGGPMLQLTGLKGWICY